MLDDYRLFAGLVVHWVLVGPSHRETRPEHGGVLRHYTRCGKVAQSTVKTITNTYFLESVDLHPHNFKFVCVPTATPVTRARTSRFCDCCRVARTLVCGTVVV